jgi:hypothetical protein
VAIARLGTHPRLVVDPVILRAGAIIIAENREEVGGDSTSDVSRISPLLMLPVTGLALVRGYLVDAYKRA